MLVTSMEFEVLLLMLKICATLRIPIVPEVKLMLVGETVTGARPVPVRPTNASRLLWLSYMLTAPDVVPTSVGVKEMFATQDLPAATLPPQLSVSEKAVLHAKTTGCADAPVFVIVTALELLVTPTYVATNVSLVAETVMFCAHEFRLAIAIRSEVHTSELQS